MGNPLIVGAEVLACHMEGSTVILSVPSQAHAELWAAMGQIEIEIPGMAKFRLRPLGLSSFVNNSPFDISLRPPRSLTSALGSPKMEDACRTIFLNILVPMATAILPKRNLSVLKLANSRRVSLACSS